MAAATPSFSQRPVSNDFQLAFNDYPFAERDRPGLRPTSGTQAI
jgi:hypothetical protein